MMAVLLFLMMLPLLLLLLSPQLVVKMMLLLKLLLLLLMLFPLMVENGVALEVVVAVVNDIGIDAIDDIAIVGGHNGVVVVMVL